MSCRIDTTLLHNTMQGSCTRQTLYLPCLYPVSAVRLLCMQISISSMSPSTNFAFWMLHPRSNHAPCTRKLYQLIPRRRHLPVPHSGINRGSHPGHAHGHIPAARPSNSKESQLPDARRRPGTPGSRYEESPQTLHCCRMRLTRNQARPTQRRSNAARETPSRARMSL